MAYVSKEVKTTVGAAISDGFSAIQELAGEMRETYDNMESANMGHMPKCEQAGEAADELENYDSEPDVPQWLQDLDVSTSEQVNKDKRRGPSRAVRLSNATSLIQAAIDTLNATDYGDLAEKIATEHKDEAGFEAPTEEDLQSEADSLVSELEDAAGVDVEFPGMFG